MSAAIAETRRNARVRGCSSMVEQQLPKLAASAVSRVLQSKTRHETPLWFQALPKWVQNILGLFLRLAWLAILANEIRGAVLAAPVIYGLWLSGGTLMAWWIALCSLGGIALSVIVPAWLLRKVR